MKGLIFTLAALSAYLVSGWNPSITFSKLIYKKDIRTCGSKNPGFTNFRRCFGDKFAWYVFVLDLFKAAAVVAVFAFLLSKYGVDHQFAAAFTGVLPCSATRILYGMALRAEKAFWFRFRLYLLSTGAWDLLQRLLWWCCCLQQNICRFLRLRRCLQAL